LSAAQAEIERLQAQLQCAQDDGLALRRRSEREKAEFQHAARGDAIVPLLPVIDDFERALTNVPDALRDDPWASGIAIIAEGMRLALQRQGVERIAADGVPFDPHYHEAVAQVENPDVPAEMVTRVYRAGYALAGRVLRPAQVQVALGSDQAPEEEQAE
jgi:molecular chaperone GrpE